jgi:uncharacterized cupredoxin-like copper-binding protein
MGCAGGRRRPHARRRAHGRRRDGRHARDRRPRRARPADPPVDDASTRGSSSTEIAFTPATVSLGAGEPVNLTVTNDGEVFHDFDLEIADVHLGLDPGEQTTAAVTIDRPGTYQASCTVPGHVAAGMVLTLEVT